MILLPKLLIWFPDDRWTCTWSQWRHHDDTECVCLCVCATCCTATDRVIDGRWIVRKTWLKQVTPSYSFRYCVLLLFVYFPPNPSSWVVWAVRSSNNHRMWNNSWFCKCVVSVCITNLHTLDKWSGKLNIAASSWPIVVNLVHTLGKGEEEEVRTCLGMQVTQCKRS